MITETHCSIPGTAYVTDTYGDLGRLIPQEAIDEARKALQSDPPARKREASRKPVKKQK